MIDILNVAGMWRSFWVGLGVLGGFISDLVRVLVQRE
jgi:hypothetical protein